MAFIAAALLASCSDKGDDYSGDFGQIKVPDTRQLEQTVTADDTQAAQGVTFTTEGAWTSAITQTRAEAPAWITISPDHGDAAGSYTIKITLDSNNSEETRTAKIVISCGTSKIEITVTQEGTDNPITPTLNSRISKIECFYEEDEHPEKDRHTWNYYFEYDNQNRITKCIFEDLEEPSEGMNQVVAFSYPDATTLKIVSSGEDHSETRRYTVTLDKAGRAVDVRRDENASRWIFSYDTGGRCIECRQSGVDEPIVYPRTTFGWENGNLTSINTFDDTGKPVKDYSFTCTYNSEMKNSAEAISIDLNALLFDVCPAYMPVYGPDIAQILAMAGRLGVRSANQTTTNLIEEEFDEQLDTDTNTRYYYQVMPENEIIGWLQENEGRVDQVVYSSLVQYIKETPDGEKEMISDKSYTRHETYKIFY